MSNKVLYILWGVLYILCAGLGFIPNPEGALRVVMVALSVLFFLPPAAVLYRSAKAGDRKTVKLLGILSAVSLLLTLLTLVVNFLSVGATEAVGNVLYGLLIVLSCPMVCSQYWVLSMFLWACLLMVSISHLRKTKE